MKSFSIGYMPVFEEDLHSKKNKINKKKHFKHVRKQYLQSPQTKNKKNIYFEFFTTRFANVLTAPNLCL